MTKFHFRVSKYKGKMFLRIKKINLLQDQSLLLNDTINRLLLASHCSSLYKSLIVRKKGENTKSMSPSVRYQICQRFIGSRVGRKPLASEDDAK